MSIYGMDLYGLRVLLAAPLASLFLVLGLCAVVLQERRPTGLRIPVIRNALGSPQEQPCPNRSILLRLTRDGRTWINENEMSHGEIAPIVAEVTENRSQRIVYVLADSEVPYGEFAEFLGRIEGSTTHLHVALISGEMRKEFDKIPIPCGFVFPTNELAPLHVSFSPVTLHHD